MSERERNTKASWTDPDDAPEWPDEVWDRAQIAIGGKVIRPATGTLTRRGRPPVGEAPKQQVTLRLPRHVLDHFKAGGAGWQTRIGEVLERHVGGAPVRSLAEIRREVADLLDKIAVRGLASHDVSQRLRALAADWAASGGEEAGRALLQRAQSVAGMVDASPEGPGREHALRDLVELKQELLRSAAAN